MNPSKTKRKSRWTKEDLEPQACVAAVILDKNPTKVLIQKHVKLKKWTIPIGKLPWHPTLTTSEVIRALHKELNEECGIQVVSQILLSRTVFKGHRDGKVMYIPMYLFLVTEYQGEIQNLEPHKHSEQKFMNPHKLRDSGEPISHALRLWLKRLDKATRRACYEPL